MKRWKLFIFAFFCSLVGVLPAAMHGSIRCAAAGDFTMQFSAGEKTYEYKPALAGSPIQQSVSSLKVADRLKVVDFAIKSGFSLEDGLYYAFPGLKQLVLKMEDELYSPFQDARIESQKNTGNVKIIKPKNGVKMNKIAFFNELYYKLSNFSVSNIYIDIPFETSHYNIDESYFNGKNILRSSFTTSFASSSEARKNNIRKALEAIDGVVIKNGQTFSFNKATGPRTEAQGYMKAKIIQNGMFVYEYGGGVCQVSTTLYNSALLAGLDAVEVHPHSLPVSYVEPCFDAMVSSASSDLVLKNNTGTDVIIASAFMQDRCVINIYGSKNIYKIVRKSQKTEDLLQFSTEMTINYEAFNEPKPEPGSQKIISYGRPGYSAEGYLEYYSGGKLVERKKIRSNTYKPVKQVVLVGE